jgi:hypothetical protein
MKRVGASCSVKKPVGTVVVLRGLWPVTYHGIRHPCTSVRASSSEVSKGFSLLEWTNKLVPQTLLVTGDKPVTDLAARRLGCPDRTQHSVAACQIALMVSVCNVQCGGN